MVALEQRQREFARLVGHACEPQPGRAQQVERLRDAVEHDRALTIDRVIVAKERRARAREVSLIHAAGEVVGQRAVHQHVGALADEGRDALDRQRWQSELRTHPVGRRGQIGRGVHQRAVEVDQDGLHLRIAHAPAWRSRGVLSYAAAIWRRIASMVAL